MKISIITAVLNRALFIEQAIKSLHNQNYPHVEHIIIDGGSTDGTIDIIKKLCRVNDLFISEQDEGIYDALNKGIRISTGEIIGIMHSDDFFVDEQVFQMIINAFSDPSIDGVYGDLDYVSKWDDLKIIRHWRAGVYSTNNLVKGWMPPHPTLFLRRKVIEEWGDFNSYDFKISADYDAILRYLKGGGINLAYVPKVLVKMRLGGESNRSFRQILVKSREDLKAIKKNKVGGICTLLMKNFSKIKQFYCNEFDIYQEKRYEEKNEHR